MKKASNILLTIIIAGAVLFLFAACQQDNVQTLKKQKGATKEKPKKDAKTAAVKQACDVLSAEEASTVMGVSLVESSDPNDANVSPTGPDDSYCAYTNNGGTDDTRRKIFFSLALSSSADGAKMAFNATKNVAGENAETVADLGDGAYWTAANETLVAIKGRYQLLIHISQPEKGGLDKAKAAADVILPRL